MIDTLTLSIGIGLVISLIFAEIFGFKAGGMVVPGYIALHLGRPFDVFVTIGVAIATFVMIRLLASFMIIYGKRRTVLCILVGFIFGSVVRILMGTAFALEATNAASVIGFIIPGLIAIWIDRQGIVETVAPLITVAVVVRLVLILTVPVDVERFNAEYQGYSYSAAGSNYR